MTPRLAAPLLLLGFSSAATAAPPPPGHHPKVNVSAPTRLDWTFVVSNRSLADPPAAWLGDYDSKKQTYELFVPARKDAKTPAPLLLYLSPGNDGRAFDSFEKLAKANGLFFAAPHKAGNDCPQRRRVRIVLDVLDDVRRNYAIDPDRTYVAGFSGGGRIACAVAFALPELFGGVMPFCAGGGLRDESWLRQRAADRLSVASMTGEKDFNHGEVTRWRGPYLSGVGVRSRTWSEPGLGHAVAGAKAQAEAFAWLEEGLAKRRDLAKQWPASRHDRPGRTAEAEALFAEGKKRLGTKADVYPGLMQVKGVAERWPDLPSGKAALRLLTEYDDKAEKPWEADDVAEQRRFLLATARALDGYATGPLAQQYRKDKPKMLEAAIGMYKEIAKDAPESEAGLEAKRRVAALEKLLEQ